MQTLAPTVHRLFELVLIIDPGQITWDALEERARDRIAELQVELEAVRARLDESVPERVRELLSAAAENLAALSAALDNSAGAKQWRHHYGALASNYDQLRKAVEALPGRVEEPFQRLSRKNYARNVFHVAGGLSAALIYHFLLTPLGALYVMLAIASVATTLEVLRRLSSETNDALMRFPLFRRIARPHEYHRLNSSTFYAFGLLVSVLLFDQRAVEVACVVLAFADPVASNLGRRYGKRKLVNGKSVVGTAAFVAAAFVVVLVYQFVFWNAALVPLMVVAGAAALAGALGELFAFGLDDNFTVPVSAAAATWAATIAIGLT